MNDRFKQPKRKQKLPAGRQAKCALAYGLIVKNMMKDGIPQEAAEAMATDVVVTILEATVIEEEAARLRYRIYPTVYNN